MSVRGISAAGKASGRVGFDRLGVVSVAPFEGEVTPGNEG